MQELRRTRAGPFAEDKNSLCVTLHDVAYWFAEWQENKDDKTLRKFIQPMEKALTLLPRIVVRDSAVDALCHGANLTAPGVLSIDSNTPKGAIAAIFTLKGEAVALANTLAPTGETTKVRHATAAPPQRVLI